MKSLIPYYEKMSAEKRDVYNSIFDLLDEIENAHPELAEKVASIGMSVDFILRD